MTSLQNNEIVRADDETPTTTTGTVASSSWYTYSRRHSRPKTFSMDRTRALDSPSDCYTSRKDHVPPPYTRRKSSSLYLPGTIRDLSDGGPDKAEDNVLMTGWLYKTSRLKTSKARAHRQRRKFKLTAHSLEYSHFNLHKVCACLYS